MNWFRRTATGYLLMIHVQPGAKRSESAGLYGDRLKLRIAAPPVEGRANDALIEFIAARLGVARNKLRVLKGVQSRTKQVEVLDFDIDPQRLLRND